VAGRIFLLGVPIDAIRAQEILSVLQGFLKTEGGKHVFTPNSEMLVASVRNKQFREALQQGALNIPDSAGLLLMARCTGQRLPERVAGADTVQMLCAELSPEHPVFLLGAGEGVAERAAEALKKRNPSLVVAGTYSGNPNPTQEDDLCERINASGAHVLFVAFGAPQQDLWIERTMKRLPSVRIAMGVGGTFDFLAGVRKRAPRFMQRMGLEWVWRLLHEPSRIGRIFVAVVVFPVFVLCYRKNEPMRITN
tara:strand:- start:821 stop:1573 length:753 start_codon:yes stop_codon:yes gene_type:complete